MVTVTVLPANIISNHRALNHSCSDGPCYYVCVCVCGGGGGGVADKPLSVTTSYLSDLLTVYTPFRQLRSSVNKPTLGILHAKTKTFG